MAFCTLYCIVLSNKKTIAEIDIYQRRDCTISYYKTNSNIKIHRSYLRMSKYYYIKIIAFNYKCFIFYKK